MDSIASMNIPVCQVFASNGFQIEYMPDFLDDREFDNHSPHVHAFYEILWFQKGTGIHTVDFREYEVRPNTVFFLSPGQVHHFDKASYQGVSIKMCADFLNVEDCLCGSFLRYNVFHLAEDTLCFQLDEDTAMELAVLIRLMEKEIQQKQAFGNREMLQSLVRMFLIQIYRHGVKEGTLKLDGMKPSHQLFVRFRIKVEKEYRHMHTVQEYASTLNVAVRTLNKCVNECAGKSPLAFINSRIMLEAMRLVRYSDLMIKEIAFTLGYEDPSYFVKMFKRYTGFMPSGFRE